MEPQRLKGFNVDVLLWADVNEVESSALTQLRKITSLPCVVHHVAAMPDVHLGRGATVGSVVAMKGAVCPAAVGVDIGCGMAAVRSTLKASDLPDSLSRLRGDIEAAVPTGFSMHEAADKDVRSLALFREFETLTPKVHSDKSVALRQLGTLGGGNHFIEVCLDEVDRVWVMLHSGSRRIGKLLAEIHIGRAKRLAHNERLLDPDLAYFLAGTPEMDAYRRDLDWAQRYAWENRRKMLELVLAAVSKSLPQAKFEAPILCHHNYVAEEVHFGEKLLVTRKGAISAKRGLFGIIPGSMGARSYVVRGLGHAAAFESASHGAGRKMSREQAKKRFSLRDLEEQTQGIECRKDRGVLDEIPGAYKDIEEVMARQKDLVEIVHELRQVVCVKG